MNAITTQPAGQLVTSEHAQAIRSALKSSLYPGATDDSVDMVLAYCRAAQLDPMTKPVHIVPIWIPEKKVDGRVVSPAGMRDVVMPGIELYRTKAHRTGDYAGQDDAEFGPTIDALGIKYPEWCKVTVYRLVNGSRVPYSARVYWLETYATAKRDTDAPNAMWKKRPFGQLEKCAEALALRKAFPEAVGAQPTAEEMEGKSIGMEEMPRPALVSQQMSKPDATPPPAYTAEEFAEKLPMWRGLIQAGTKSADAIIAMVGSKRTLSAEQLKAIRDCDKPPAHEPEEAAAGEGE